MQIVCSCGISYQVYDYPPAEVEEGGKKMMERHIMCPCDREVVVRTAPKYEPTAPLVEGEETSRVVSFEEMSRRLGVGKNTTPPSAKVPTWGPSSTPPTEAPEAISGAPSLIVDPNATPNVTGTEKSIFLTQEDADVLGNLIAHYGMKFKDPEAQKEEAQEFADLAARAKQEGMFTIFSDKEERMCRMGFLERNVKKLWPIGPYDDESDHNVQCTVRANDLRERFKKLCGWDK